jgi:predicted metal-dependent hydrolase
MRESETEFPPARTQAGGEIPYLGERLELSVSTERHRQRGYVARRGAELKVALPPDADLREALEGWYRRQARSEVALRLDAAVARAGRGYTSLQIRGQRTRWASCSTSGAMSFNWRLLLAPAEILDYVVEHEVAHLDVQDHSARFWRLLGSRSPRWRQHEAWLRRHGHALSF